MTKKNHNRVRLNTPAPDYEMTEEDIAQAEEATKKADEYDDARRKKTEEEKNDENGSRR